MLAFELVCSVTDMEEELSRALVGSVSPMFIQGFVVSSQKRANADRV